MFKIERQDYKASSFLLNHITKREQSAKYSQNLKGLNINRVVQFVHTSAMGSPLTEVTGAEIMFFCSYRSRANGGIKNRFLHGSPLDKVT